MSVITLLQFWTSTIRHLLFKKKVSENLPLLSPSPPSQEKKPVRICHLTPSLTREKSQRDAPPPHRQKKK